MAGFQQAFGLHKGYQLLGSPAFFALPDAVRAVRTNGCGPAGIFNALVPEKMHGLDVSPGCDIHDDRYKRQDPKLRADIEMLGNHARIIGTAAFEEGKWLTVKRLYRAASYCAAVVLFGGKAYRNA